MQGPLHPYELLSIFLLDQRKRRGSHIKNSGDLGLCKGGFFKMLVAVKAVFTKMVSDSQGRNGSYE